MSPKRPHLSANCSQGAIISVLPGPPLRRINSLARGIATLATGISDRLVNGFVAGPIGQCYHRADTGEGHQASAHLIVADNGQQAPVQNADLLAQYPPHNE